MKMKNFKFSKLQYFKIKLHHPFRLIWECKIKNWDDFHLILFHITFLTIFSVFFIACGKSKNSSQGLPGVYLSQYDYPYDVALNSSAKKLYVSNNLSATVYEISTDSNGIIRTFKVPDRPSHVALSPDNSRLYVTHTDRKTKAPTERPAVGEEVILSEINLSGGNVSIRAFNQKDYCWPVDIAVSNSSIYISCYGDDSGSADSSFLYIFDSQSFSLKKKVSLKSAGFRTAYVLGVALNPASDSVYTAYSGTKVETQTVCTGECETYCDNFCKAKCAYDCSIIPEAERQQCITDCYDESSKSGTCWDDCSYEKGEEKESSTSYYYIYEYSGADGTKLKDFNITSRCSSPSNVAVDKSGEKLYVTCSGNGNIVVVNTTTKAIEYTTLPKTSDGYSAKPLDLVFDPTGNYLYITDPREEVNVKTGKLNTGRIHKFSISDKTVKSFDTGRYPAAVAVDSSKVYIANTVDNFIHILNP